MKKRSAKRKEIVVTGLVPPKGFFEFMRYLARKYRVTFLAPEMSYLKIGAYRETLKEMGVNFIEDAADGRRFEEYVKKGGSRIEAVVLMPQEYSSINKMAKVVRTMLPNAKFVLFAEDLPFGARDTRAPHGPYVAFLDAFRAKSLVDCSFADALIINGNINAKNLKRELESTTVLSYGEFKELASKKSVGEIAEPRKKNGLTSIIIPCHNKLEFTRKCIGNVRQYTDGPYELITVDNGSTDGTREYLSKLEGTTVIRNEKNEGFAKAVNMGIRRSRGDYVAVLNNDVLVTPAWLGGLRKCVDSCRSIGLAGPKTNNTFGYQRIGGAAYSDAGSLSKWAQAFNMMFWGEYAEVFWLTGFCILIKREVIKDVGLFDERFKTGTYEDYDYCVRARRKGYRIFCAGDVYVHHHGSATFDKGGYLKLNMQNKGLFEKKWGKRMYEYVVHGSNCTICR
ncbi:MAG: glycosyltransferase family 2 protein [Endomicrobiales bacterium]|nr:glycosyltransferase family 2 protein [Endomicrobiales bacterium]